MVRSSWSCSYLWICFLWLVLILILSLVLYCWLQRIVIIVLVWHLVELVMVVLFLLVLCLLILYVYLMPIKLLVSIHLICYILSIISIHISIEISWWLVHNCNLLIQNVLRIRIIERKRLENFDLLRRNLDLVVYLIVDLVLIHGLWLLLLFFAWKLLLLWKPICYLLVFFFEIILLLIFSLRLRLSKKSFLFINILPHYLCWWRTYLFVWLLGISSIIVFII